MLRPLSFLALALVLSAAALRADDPKPLKVLFLGDNAGHKPVERYRLLEPVLAKRGIELVYTDKVESLNAKNLANYDALLIYANITKISPEQEKALFDFVEGGKGFVPLHCASYCFLNSPKYIDLVGAQFQKHGAGTFRTTVAEPDHPIMKGYKGFESWDETYVHTKHNEKNRTVLEYRAEGDKKEPWTWVRTQGRGRVFYTAWGHDQKTWSNPGFHELVERGIRWACGQDPTTVTRPDGPPPPTTAVVSPFERPFPVPEMTAKRTDVKPFEYVDVGRKIPNYRPRGGQGEPLNMMQKPLPAEESQKHVVVPKGFRAEVFVTEKELGGKPICMTWDERGRLWAAITLDYPNELNPPTKGRDKIVVCEDTDGDGKADKVTVFADGLSIPTSITFARGGVIVFDATQTVFLKDTDGDGKADVRQVLFGTWSMRDTHGGPSNMHYGLDNWVWAMQGYNASELTVGGETHRFRQGFFRFRPDGSKLEFLRSTNNNTWGLGISEEGIIFGSTANGNPSEHMPIPNRYYEMVRGWAPSLVLRGIADTYRFRPITEHVRQVDFHGGYTAAAGHALYTARAYPKEYWNRAAFVAEPTGHLVGTFVLRRDGTHFRSSNPFNLFASDDEWAAPIMAEVGPDGNVWVIDWYNFIVQHNPTPQGFRTGRGAAYESDLRDKTHGRIYRVVYEGNGGKPNTFTLAGATPEKLVETLKNDNLFWRRHAQRLLVERGERDVLPALYALAKDTTVDEIGLNAGAIHALWTIHGLGALDGSNPGATAVAVGALRHPSAGVRRNAVQVLPREPRSVDAIVAAGLTRDPDPQVRLMTLLALADQPAGARAGAAVVEALTRPEDANDRWIPDAATAAAAKNAEHFLRSLDAAKPAGKLPDVVAVVAEHYARGGVAESGGAATRPPPKGNAPLPAGRAPVDTVGGVIAALADADPAVADAAVRGLAKGWPSGQPPKLDEATEKNLVRLAGRLSPERRGVLVRLAAGWGSKEFAKAGGELSKGLLTRVKDAAAAPATRVAAAEELLGYQPADADLVKAIFEQVTPQAAPELVVGLLRALRASEAPDTAELILGNLPSLTPAARSAGIGVLLARPEWTRKLIAAMDAGKLQVTDLALDQKQALGEHPDTTIRNRALAVLKRGGALPSPDRQKVIDDYLASTKEKGDVAAGKVVFKNQCAKCHKHNGEGENIGPDLTGMAVHPKEELLVHILDPSRSVEGNFRLYRVTKKDGSLALGMLASESKTAVELIDTDGKRHSILRDDIDELVGSNKSLMPDGFEKQVSVKDMTHLLEFLTQKGKYFPLVLDKVATAVSTKGMFYSETAPGERLVFGDWKPKTFEGVPFVLTDPQGDKVPNVVMLYGPQGNLPPKMPRSVSLPCNTPAKAIHLLSGVSGWGYPYSDEKTVSMTVRIHYAGGKTEDHALRNGEHFADYIRRVDVPGSRFAFDLRGRQVRYLKVEPRETEKIDRIELVKGPDGTAPVVMAVTLELPE
jgi:putative membrane-bound dehydrogenase-like protein